MTRVLSSPLQRARDTAAAIAAEHGLEVEVDERLIELDYGDWDGMALTDVPRGRRGRRGAPIPTFAPPGGERLADVTARVALVLLRRARRDDLVVAVSHVSPIKAAVCSALQVDERVTWRMQLDVASVTRIGRRPDGSAVSQLVQRRVIRLGPEDLTRSGPGGVRARARVSGRTPRCISASSSRSSR